jgi:single-strand DNA-binding protein
VAINDSYKAKGSSEVTKVVTYAKCDYWVNPGVAQYLTKGTLVELQGRVGVNAYMGKNGTAKAALTFHANTIKLHGNTKSAVENNAAPVVVAKATDDLPF